MIRRTIAAGVFSLALLAAAAAAPIAAQNGAPAYWLVHCGLQGKAAALIARDAREIRKVVAHCRELGGAVGPITPVFK